MLSYEESLQRLECDLAENLKNNGFTMAGYMDIENLQKCLKENTNLKMQIDELVKWLEEEIEKYEENTVINRAKPNVRFWRLYDLREILSKLKEVKKDD